MASALPLRSTRRSDTAGPTIGCLGKESPRHQDAPRPCGPRLNSPHGGSREDKLFYNQFRGRGGGGLQAPHGFHLDAPRPKRSQTEEVPGQQGPSPIGPRSLGKRPQAGVPPIPRYRDSEHDNIVLTIVLFERTACVKSCRPGSSQGRPELLLWEELGSTRARGAWCWRLG